MVTFSTRFSVGTSFNEAMWAQLLGLACCLMRRRRDSNEGHRRGGRKSNESRTRTCHMKGPRPSASAHASPAPASPRFAGATAAVAAARPRSRTQGLARQLPLKPQPGCTTVARGTTRPQVRMMAWVDIHLKPFNHIGHPASTPVCMICSAPCAGRGFAPMVPGHALPRIQDCLLRWPVFLRFLSEQRPDVQSDSHK